MDSDSVYFKNLSGSGPVQFKSMLFKGQLYHKMITCLVNIHQVHSSRICVWVMRNAKIYSLLLFSVTLILYNILIIAVMICITPPWLIYFITESVYLWVPSPISPNAHLLSLATTNLSLYLWACSFYF